ncbi:pilus assembly protein TadE [Frankia sp. CcI49]|uniref:TadE/TadG family type IV pilus assembly protein n=1 Tax=Frankia sp. CcI49 TaxID=1745382 RepID=UPI00097596EC|nr:TadE/TadG family type IV pilus assembly protein [Frankia sp. CcI49]ONH51363.1 pilus assembly protein TadE [Frankia sp. CcI49]
MPRRRADTGALTVEMIFVLPLVLTIVLILAQVTVWAHASHIAQTTATRALAAARADGGSVAAGEQQAQDTLDQLGRASLTSPQVTVTRDGEAATVHVHGTAASVIPGLRLGIDADAAGAVERRRPVL